MSNRIFLMAMITMVGSIALACNIPVFRYALERWHPDPCEILVFHQQDLSASEMNVLQGVLPTRVGGSLVKRSVEPAQSLGEVKFVNTTEMAADLRSLWERRKGDAKVDVPYVMVRGDVGPLTQFPLWNGSLAEFGQSGVFQSPARKELCRRLVAGDAVIWLLIAGADEEATDQARKQLAEELPRLSKQINLPEGIGLPGSELYSEVPLLVQFSQLEIDRDDDKEAFLINLFSSIRPEETARGEPLVVPVFGRGRALEVIPASALNSQLMMDLTLFLSGACSCQVKDQNPGFDLLIDHDWNQDLFASGDEPPPAKSIKQGRGSGQTPEPQLLDIPPGR